MSRSGYCDDLDDQWRYIMWRGAVTKAIKGRRGQAFLLEMHRALEALPEKKLIANNLEADGAVCAIGSVGKARGVDMSKIDPEDNEGIAQAFGIPHALACEIMFTNDESWFGHTPEERYDYVKKWIESQLLPVPIEDASNEK